MARKRKMNKKDKERLPAVDGGGSTDEEGVPDHHDGEDDAKMASCEDDIPDIVDEDSDDEDDRQEAEEETEEAKVDDIKPKKEESVKKKNRQKKEPKSGLATAIPFMDTFYQLSAEDSPEDRSVAAGDLIHHCFLTDRGVNRKDAAYALNRLMNGLCTGRAASRQGFASCLSSFLRVAHSPSLNEVSDGRVVEGILEEDSKVRNEEFVKDVDDAHAAMIVRWKLLSVTQYLPTKDCSKGEKGQNEKRVYGKVKGIEERDNAFGRLFGILAVVRSGILGLEGFPSVVVEGYVKDLVDLYHYKNWMKEPSAHALIELLSSLDSQTNLDLITRVTNNVITPAFFLSTVKNSDNDTMNVAALSADQIAVALHLQMPRNDVIIKYDYPLDEPLLTAESVLTLSTALACTSNVVHPRCHIVWNAIWMYLTEEAKGQGQHRQLRANKEFPSIIEKIIQHVVLDRLLGQGEESMKPTNERRSLALQIVCALSGSSEHKIVLPPDLVGSILTPEVVTRVFLNVLCASGGGSLRKKKAQDGGGGGVEHHLKPLTSRALMGLVDHCCEDDDVDRQLAFAKAFLLVDARFDIKTRTQTVSSLLMLESSSSSDTNEEYESRREALWQRYLSFLEEKIVSVTSLSDATVYIELMYTLAKRNLTKAPANEASRVVRFFMSGAFFDCMHLTNPLSSKTSSCKKKKKTRKGKMETASPPQELSSGFCIKNILKANGIASISLPARAIMSARFYSLLSDHISVINSQNRRGDRNKSFYGKGSRPEAIYRAISEICGLCSLLDSSGAKQFRAASVNLDANGNASDTEDPMEVSKKFMLQVQNIANDALVKECEGAGDDKLRAKAMFATGCASLMMSLSLRLNSCGEPDTNNDDDEDGNVFEAVHDYISDLAECVEGLCQVAEDESSSSKKDDQENPLAAMAGLLVNILSSPVGGEHIGKTNPIQASASKLIRETVKLAWSGIISLFNGLSAEYTSLKNLVDEEVMRVLIESVCGEKSIRNEDEESEEESIGESVMSGDSLGDNAVFVHASESGMELDEFKDNKSDDEPNTSGSERSDLDGTHKEDDEDVNLDPDKLENLLLEDSDEEMNNSGILEHHAGADKALAQLIKLKQEAQKASQTERRRVDLCNRLRCAGLLDSLFSVSVFKSGWLPIDVVLGSIVPILRSRKVIAKSIQSLPSSNVNKSLNERNALLDRLSVLVKDKISKFRCTLSSEDVALKVSSDIYDEMKYSLNKDQCSCCSVALISTLRCIPNVEDNDGVKDIYSKAVKDWSSRKATKIHVCVFYDLIQRMPSLAALNLMRPLITAASDAHSAFLKCESIKLLSAIYKHEKPNAEEQFSKKARKMLQESCSKIVETLRGALHDSSLHKSKHRNEVLNATKQFITYLKAQDKGILTHSEICSLQETLKTVGDNLKSTMVKQLCSQLCDTISGLARIENKSEETTPKAKCSKAVDTPKTRKKRKKSAK